MRRARARVHSHARLRAHPAYHRGYISTCRSGKHSIHNSHSVFSLSRLSCAPPLVHVSGHTVIAARRRRRRRRIDSTRLDSTPQDSTYKNLAQSVPAFAHISHTSARSASGFFTHRAASATTAHTPFTQTTPQHQHHPSNIHPYIHPSTNHALQHIRLCAFTRSVCAYALSVCVPCLSQRRR